MPTPFHDWKANLLRARDLNAPDGRPLYDYRLEEAEFTSLESLLRKSLAQYVRLASIRVIGSQVTGFPALFVLYAAEWWRQRYDGSGWSWEPILRDLGVDADGWSQAQRSACVSLGLQDWRLSLRESGGLRFLGTIALQGGLPMRLLAEAKGGLGRLLRSVLKEAAKSIVTVNDIQGWVQSLDHYLPRTYRQTEIHVLLAEVVATVLRLKEEAELTQSAGAVVRLEQRIPSWRKRFPLPVGDADAQGLIEQLIQDAAAVKIERQTKLFLVERFLERGQDGLWHLRSGLTVSDVIPATKLASFFASEAIILPRFLELTLAIGDCVQVTSVRRLAGHDSFRVERRPWDAVGSDAAEEHVLRLSAPDGQVWPIAAPRGEKLDDDLPWIFDSTDNSPKLLRQGSGSVTDSAALVAIPPDWTVVPGSDGTATPQGQIHLPARQLFRISGTVRFSSNQDEACRIRTGRADTKEEIYEWVGQRSWQNFLRPGMAFLGRPRLFQTDEEGRSQPISSEPGWRPLGARPAPGTEPIGPIEVWYPAKGEVKHRSRMVVLPPAAILRLEFLGANSGRLHLDNWGAMSAQVLSPDVVADVNRSGMGLTLLISTQPGAVSPEWVELDLYWPNTPTPVRLRLPYPARGARVYNASGQELLPGALLAANQLTGVRIHCLSGNPAAMPRITLEFRLLGKNKESIHVINLPKNSVHAEVRLQDYVAEIAHLLVNDDGADASVEAVLRIGGEAAANLRITRYACRMARNGGRVSLDAAGFRTVAIDALAELPVMALRLETPGEEAIRLPMLVSQDVANGTWEFEPEKREAGSWLIFPAPGAALPFRPTLWTIRGEVEFESEFAQAIGHSERDERERALDAAIHAMACDFLHAGWPDVERLAGQLGHLPLVTLDLWRRFARSPSGMAALAMRFGTLPDGFFERFSLELPFAWETVPFNTWRCAIEQLQQQCDTWYGVAGVTAFRSHLENRIAELSTRHPALSNLLRFVQAAITREMPREIPMFHKLGVAGISDMLYTGEQSILQRLLRNHSDIGNGIVQWPDNFNGRVAQARKHPLRAGLLCQQNYGFHDGLINFPILLAIQTATDDTEEWFENSDLTHDLRTHMAFDPDWFADAYNWTMASCLAAGLLNLEVAQ